ncbi:MAG: site-specific integrase [Eubacteriales bacterium]|nr:site-specific integrase [Eubacteriales bacterium]
MQQIYQTEQLEWFRKKLLAEEKSPYTIDKYLRDVGAFFRYVSACRETERNPEAGEDDGGYDNLRDRVLSYKKYLQSRYKVSSVNSILNALNKYLKLSGKAELCVRTLRQQRRLFCDGDRVLRRCDYRKLVEAADREGKKRLSCIIQTLGMTGLRIGELHYLNMECLEKRCIHIEHKGKIRDIVLPGDLIRLLRNYCREQRIKGGAVFTTKNGTPVDRKNIWHEMKLLCRRAGVAERRVFPHNLRHLFATAFYEKKKDIVRLADYLGHSNLETTRRYTTISSMQACQRELDLGLLVTKSGDRAAKRIQKRKGRGKGQAQTKKSADSTLKWKETDIMQIIWYQQATI